MTMKIKHPQLMKNESGQLVFHCKSQSKARNTESLYIIETNELYMAGVRIEKHPRFEDIVQFENWCNEFWATNKMGL